MRYALHFCFALFLALSGCYVSKPLEAEVRVSLNETVPVKITRDEGATFVTFFTEADYQKAYLDGMKASFGYDKLVIDNANPQFVITITSLELTEKTTTDTVKDEKSKDNGKIYDIAVATLKTSGTLVNLSTQKSIAWTADKDRSERITNAQTLGQAVKGENKDMVEYHKKDFERNEFVNLSSECGRRAATVITNNIRRQLKN